MNELQISRCEDDEDEEETKCEMLEVCARRIQTCWRSRQNRKVFQLLVRSVHSAEACLTPALIRQLSPQETNLLRDPSVQCKVRFRLAGFLFPPVIVFKIFHTGRGGTYLSGKNLFQPSNQATVDTCRMMGNRKFMDLMMEDENHWKGRTIWQPADVMCTRDYIQFSSHLDELPARVGGRENGWRCLSLKSLRCGGGKGVTGNGPLKEESTGATVNRPSDLRSRSPVAPPPSAVSTPGPRTPKRRSARAQAHTARMRAVYKPQQEEQIDVKDRDEEADASLRSGHVTDSQMKKHKEDQKEDFIPNATKSLTLGDITDCEWEEEAELLCSWTNQLSLDWI